MAEDCIRINIHVPYQYLPNSTQNPEPGPVLVFIHGGGFSCGSGDTYLHGPEYLTAKNVVVVTFNYRLNVFGFFSMNNEYFTGNNGLRDAITALKWVKKNIKKFGGDPDRVTVGGQSAGAIMAHLLSLSPAANGLFKQVVAISGLAIVSAFSYSNDYVKVINTIFFKEMGINPLLPPRWIHELLVIAPLSKILQANKAILDIYGTVSFVPVIEEPHDNFTMVVSEDPEVLIKEGTGKEYPILLGYSNNETQSFKKRLMEINTETKLRLLPFLIVPFNLLYPLNPLTVGILTAKQLAKYYTNKVPFITLDKFLIAQNDASYLYLSQRLILQRLAAGANNTYIYEFAYPGERSSIKLSSGQSYEGAGHVEDITYFFRTNSFLGFLTGDELSNSTNDDRMKNIMTTCIANFVTVGSPALTYESWLPTEWDMSFQLLDSPAFKFLPPTPHMTDTKKHFDELYQIASKE